MFFKGKNPDGKEGSKDFDFVMERHRKYEVKNFC